MDGLTQYLALECGALSRKVDEQQRKHLACHEQWIIMRSRFMEAVAAEQERANELDTFAHWAVAQMKFPNGRIMPIRAIRAIYENEDRWCKYVDQETGQEWITKGNLDWQLIINLTDDE